MFLQRKVKHGTAVDWRGRRAQCTSVLYHEMYSVLRLGTVRDMKSIITGWLEEISE